jgi:hypothetical protein
VHTDPAAPSLHRTIDDFVSKTGGVVGPHTSYALPGRMLITGLSKNDGRRRGDETLWQYRRHLGPSCAHAQEDS